MPFITYKKYVQELTDEQIITFEAWDKESQQELYKKILPTRNSLQLENAYRKQQTVLLKPESVSISHKYNYLYLYIPSGTIGIPLTDELLDYILQLQSTNIYFEVTLNKKVAISNTKAIYLGECNAIYEADYDMETARELLKEHRAIDLMMYALGYKPTSDAIASKMAILLPLFRYNDKAIHTATFTPPRYGKTRSASILRGLTSAYLTTLPSPAKLVYDGSKNKYGLTFFYNTIYIDEFDKIQSGKRKDTFKESYEILLTGMSEGYWTREVSSKAEDFNNLVGFCFMGNWDTKMLSGYQGINEYSKTTRSMLYDLLHEIVDPEPLLERLAYVEFIDQGHQAYKLLNYNENYQVRYLHPKVSRAVIKILQERCIEQPIHKEIESEMDHHFNAVKSVLNVLGLEVEDADIEKLVEGHASFFEVLQEDSPENNEDDFTPSVDESEMLKMMEEQWT